MVVGFNGWGLWCFDSVGNIVDRTFALNLLSKPTGYDFVLDRISSKCSI